MSFKPASRPVAGLSALAADYDVILSDVWGVVHDGRTHTPSAADALTRFRQKGGTVVLITNAPRPRAPFNLEARRQAGFTEDELARLGSAPSPLPSA